MTVISEKYKIITSLRNNKAIGTQCVGNEAK